MSAATRTSPEQSLPLLLRALRLPSVARYHEEVAQKAEREGWSFGHYLRHLAALEEERENFSFALTQAVAISCCLDERAFSTAHDFERDEYV